MNKIKTVDIENNIDPILNSDHSICYKIKDKCTWIGCVCIPIFTIGFIAIISYLYSN